jgi:Flp pilus assembly protein TadG
MRRSDRRTGPGPGMWSGSGPGSGSGSAPASDAVPAPGCGRLAGRDERGYVTAETAIVIPVLVALAGLLIWGLSAVVAQVECVDAARAGARAAARTEPAADVLQAAREAAPSGARVSADRAGDLVTVRVTVPWPRFPVTLQAQAAALAEDAVDGGGEP